MRFAGAIFCLFSLILAISIVSAGSYSIEYSQVDDKIVIKETINGIAKESYVSGERLDKSEEGYYFIKRLVFNESYNEAQIKFSLDRGFILGDNGVFPAGYEAGTDGQVIIVSWKLNNVNAGEVFPMFVKIIDTSRTNSAPWIVLDAILLLIFAYLVYREKSKKAKIKVKAKKSAKKEKANVQYEHLLDAEKKVIELLKGADRHELWQKQIQNSTGFSKAKVSRLVRNLEARGLVVKIPFGNTNKIRLK